MALVLATPATPPLMWLTRNVPVKLGSFAQFVFGFEEGGGERAVGVGVDERGVGARGVVGGFGDVAAGEDRNGAEEMIGILLVNDALDRRFRGGDPDARLAG